MVEEEQLRERVQKIADLVRRLDAAPDPGTRVQVQELLQSFMDLHGEAFERVLGRLRGTGPGGEALVESMAADPVVSSVLLLYGLHPLEFDTRVRAAMEKLQEELRPRGVILELAGTQGGDVRIRVRAVEDAAMANQVKSITEDALYAAAPDATSVVFLGLERFSQPDFVPLASVGMLAGKGID